MRKKKSILVLKQEEAGKGGMEIIETSGKDFYYDT